MNVYVKAYTSNVKAAASKIPAKYSNHNTTTLFTCSVTHSLYRFSTINKFIYLFRTPNQAARPTNIINETQTHKHKVHQIRKKKENKLSKLQ